MNIGQKRTNSDPPKVAIGSPPTGLWWSNSGNTSNNNNNNNINSGLNYQNSSNSNNPSLTDSSNIPQEPIGRRLSDAKSFEFSTRKAQLGHYMWLNPDYFTMSPYQDTNRFCGTIEFQAQAQNDIHVCFAKLSEMSQVSVGREGIEASPSYELVIGGWLNTKTALRKHGSVLMATSKRSAGSQAVISSKDFQSYWISVSPDGLFSLGKGRFSAQATRDDLMLQYRDPHYEQGVCFIGFSSWDSPIHYRGIKIHSIYLSTESGQEGLITFGQGANALPNLYSHPNFTDVTIKGQNKSFMASKAILASFSGYFKRLFESWPNMQLFSFCEPEPDIISPRTESLRKGTQTSLVNSGSFSSSFKVTDIRVDSFELAQVIKFCYLKNSYLGNELLQIFEIPQTPSMKQLSWLYLNPLFSDIDLVVEDKTIPAHKAVLAAGCEYFYTIFASQFRESQQRQVVMHSVGYESFLSVIEYLYYRLELKSIEDAAAVLELADRFGLTNLMETCFMYFEEHLNDEYCCELLGLTNLFQGSFNFRAVCMRYIEKHFERVVKTDGFLFMDFNDLMQILASDDLALSREEVAFEAVVQWVRHDKHARLAHVSTLLSKIRFGLLSDQYLEHSVLTNKLVRKTNVSEMIQQALQLLKDEQDQQVLMFQGPSSSLVLAPNGLKTRRGNYTELQCSHPGDDCGVFYWLGSQGKTVPWSNPMLAGKISISMSSPKARFTNASWLSSRTFRTTCFCTGNPPWILIDLKDHVLICNHYTLQIDRSQDYPRNWKLQSSHDAEKWFDLREHKNDDSLTSQGAHAGYAVTGKNTTEPYRYFRILANPDARQLSICGVELYGLLKKV